MFTDEASIRWLTGNTDRIPSGIRSSSLGSSSSVWMITVQGSVPEPPNLITESSLALTNRRVPESDIQIATISWKGTETLTTLVTPPSLQLLARDTACYREDLTMVREEVNGNHPVTTEAAITPVHGREVSFVVTAVHSDLSCSSPVSYSSLKYGLKFLGVRLFVIIL